MAMEQHHTHPWSRSDVYIQIAVVLATVVYTSIALGIVNPMFAAVYPALVALFIIVNQRFICRDCMYYGTLCGSFGMGRVKLFKPTGKKYFDMKTGNKTMMLFYAVCLLPIGLLWMIEPFYLWEGIYIALLGTGFTLHYRRGCKKCDLKHCNLHPDHV
jgi:hypothetical protein